MKLAFELMGSVDSLSQCWGIIYLLRTYIGQKVEKGGIHSLFSASLLELEHLSSSPVLGLEFIPLAPPRSQALEMNYTASFPGSLACRCKMADCGTFQPL